MSGLSLKHQTRLKMRHRY